MSVSSTGRHHVVIVGCGFGGLSAVKALRRADVDVTVIDRTRHHLIQPLLCQVATGILSEGDIAPPIREILGHQRNTRVILGEVVDIDLDGRRVTVETTGQSKQISYDSLIVAAGASQSYFGHPEFARYAPGVKTIDHALELRGRILGAFEMAARATDPDARRRWLTFVVVGAGPTGVELAGQLVELSRRSMRGNSRRDPAEARVVLLGECADHPPAFSRGASRAGCAGSSRDRSRDSCRHGRHRRRRAGHYDELDRLRCGGSMRRRRSGPPVSRRRDSVQCSPTSRASSSIEPVG
jgi:NADH dehydrogenase